MKIEYTDGCICTSLTVDGKETAYMTPEEIKVSIRAMLDRETDIATLQDDTYKVLNGELYKCDDTQYPEDTSYLVDVRSNGDGTYKYIVQFYNGGTWLNEVLEEGLNNLK